MIPALPHRRTCLGSSHSGYDLCPRCYVSRTAPGPGRTAFVCHGDAHDFGYYETASSVPGYHSDGYTCDICRGSFRAPVLHCRVCTGVWPLPCCARSRWTHCLSPGICHRRPRWRRLRQLPDMLHCTASTASSPRLHMPRPLCPHARLLCLTVDRVRRRCHLRLRHLPHPRLLGARISLLQLHWCVAEAAPVRLQLPIIRCACSPASLEQVTAAAASMSARDAHLESRDITPPHPS